MESAFAATLSARERRLAGRLEGFGDIVFGFAMSQCALQLPIDHGHVDLARIATLTAYFGTFAVLVSLWLSFHRFMSDCFRPAGVDLVLAFGYLAFVTLMPYAMFSITHLGDSLAAARAALAEYAVIFAVVLSIGSALTIRNLRRGWYFQTDDDRVYVWRAFVRRSSLAVAVCASCAVDLAIGPVASGYSFFGLVVVPRIVLALFGRPPSPEALHISPATEVDRPAS